MKCQHCRISDTKVIESRDAADGAAIRRRRECTKCGHRFTTYERLERPQLIVVKNDGTRELFDRDKLLAGIQRSCQKTAVPLLEIETVVARVEEQLYAKGEPEVSSRHIGELVMDELALLDEVAYVRFASVYRRFKDLTSFEQELSRMRQRRESEEHIKT